MMLRILSAAEQAEEGVQQKKKRHLFISYSWDNQEAVIEIKDKLKVSETDYQFPAGYARVLRKFCLKYSL